MNSKDKTRQKLVGSMRKTKVAAGIGEDPAEEKTTAPAQLTPKQPRSGGQPKTSQAVSLTGGPGPDPYQCGRRVWPD